MTSLPLPDIWPVTIVRARYGGSYEPGEWLAFPLEPYELGAGQGAAWRDR